MSLSEKVKTRAVSAQHKNSIDRWLDTLPDEERAAALEMLNDPTWSQRELRWAFAEEGFRVSTATISEWRMVNNRVTLG